MAAQAAVRATVERFGRIDVVVHNAGYANTNSIEDFAWDDFRAQIDTNFYGAVHVTRAALPVLRAQRAGLMMQISSIGGRRGGFLAKLSEDERRRDDDAWRELSASTDREGLPDFAALEIAQMLRRDV